MTLPLLAVVGLRREAALLEGPGVRVIVGGGDKDGLYAKLRQALAGQRPRAVLSLGIGGALAPQVKVGDWTLASRVVHLGESWASDLTLVRSLQSALETITPASGAQSRVHVGPLAGSDTIVADATSKAALYAATGALAVDMESHIAAGFAAEHGLPFAALRVISDEAHRALPKAAQAGMTAGGGMDVLAVLGALARDPRQLPALIRTGLEAEVAFQRLKLLNRHDLLGRLGVGDPDLGQLLLHVV